MGSYLAKSSASDIQRFGKLSGHGCSEIPIMIIGRNLEKIPVRNM
jgi:hypothetical protein